MVYRFEAYVVYTVVAIRGLPSGAAEIEEV
jgi:hypothetical protein